MEDCESDRSIPKGRKVDSRALRGSNNQISPTGSFTSTFLRAVYEQRNDPMVDGNASLEYLLLPVGDKGVVCG
jgi:hypothetical protein